MDIYRQTGHQLFVIVIEEFTWNYRFHSIKKLKERQLGGKIRIIRVLEN